jgi:23S rRNA pseudouridine1911/1915/1917 synthase
LEIEKIYEDNHLLIVNKPAGTLVQGDRTGDTTILEALKVYLAEKYHKPGKVFLGIVHRLDRPVSGVLLLARTSKALSRLNQQFKSRQVEKTYWAVVDRLPQPQSGVLIHWIRKDVLKNRVRVYDQCSPETKEAELSYRVMAESGQKYLLEVKPVTGRPHQIRAQLSRINCPIMGDLKYGSKKANQDGNISLHAFSLRIEHPVKKEVMEVQCLPPPLPPWSSFNF